MPVFQSRLDIHSEEFAANRHEMMALIDELATLEQRAVDVSNRRRPVFEQRNHGYAHKNKSTHCKRHDDLRVECVRIRNKTEHLTLINI